MTKNITIALCTFWLMAGCQGPSYPLPKSQKLPPEKVEQILGTIGKNYPHLSSEIRANILKTVVQSLDNMVFVEGGEFQMGDFGWPYDDDPTNMCDWPCGVDPDRMGNITIFGDDDFVHPVKLSSYHLSKFQTTIENFDLFFIAQGIPVFNAERRTREDLNSLHQPDLPAPARSWQEAKDYCDWIGQLSGYPVDLPTEAQWEYAARNRGQHVAFPTDNGSLNYGRNFPEPGNMDTFPVDKFPPNPLGIYNLSGNATDWVSDWYDKDYYRHSPIENPKGPSTGTQRIWRGAHMLEDPLLSASTVRRWNVDPVQGGYYAGMGFRCSIQSDKQL
ncbi:formylglycine-generating enzyme required for sulfatase activity [Pseudomonas hunanensis]|uniref:Formylglycine-generating enzyme required for sulfatase activity n=1 Tax=Pseudomonas hunanensis TaxID=1247546 RepID=A0ACC6K5J4_9PSED|nr:SUMF1/EgtB/PvdO family nonheme iron enzyme [Pseudomonas hunanensis]MDR6713626.1 formylglycine-generating enzyme required for sulfatase activity [Pseudomonas hunanensis]